MVKDKRYKKAIIGTIVGIITNLFLSLVKFIAGAISGSAALQADAFHSLSDMITSIGVLIGIKIAAKPPDKDHPYGHGKAESITAWLVAAILVAIALSITYEAIVDIIVPRNTQPPKMLALWVALLSVLLNELLFQYKYRLGKKVKSSSLEADAWHHRSDAFSSIAVLAGIAGAIIGGEKFYFLDNVSAIFVGLLIGITGVKLLKKTTNELMDTVLDDDVLAELEASVAAIKEVKSITNVIARKSGLDILVDLEIQVNGDLTVKEGHDIAHRVQDKIMADLDSITSVLVHVEPYDSD